MQTHNGWGTNSSKPLLGRPSAHRFDARCERCKRVSARWGKQDKKHNMERQDRSTEYGGTTPHSQASQAHHTWAGRTDARTDAQTDGTGRPTAKARSLFCRQSSLLPTCASNEQLVTKCAAKAATMCPPALPCQLAFDSYKSRGSQVSQSQATPFALLPPNAHLAFNLSAGLASCPLSQLREQSRNVHQPISPPLSHPIPSHPGRG